MQESIANASLIDASFPSRTPLIIIDRNILARSCLARSLSNYDASYLVESHSTIEAWENAGPIEETPIVLLCCTGKAVLQSVVSTDVDRVRSRMQKARIIVVSDIDDPSNVVDALSKGANGFIPMSSNLDVAVAAIRLVKAGGLFVPAASLRAQPPAEVAPSEAPSTGPFSPRQIDVIERLRKGESNKIIAFALNMHECTVKVHVRNIMKKIRARNRTEIAFLTNHMFA